MIEVNTPNKLVLATDSNFDIIY